MRKKTNKIVYVILGVLSILFFAFAAFAVAVRRQDFLAEGDMLMAEFCIQLGIIVSICGFILLGVIFLFLGTDKRAAQKQAAFFGNCCQDFKCFVVHIFNQNADITYGWRRNI